MALNDKQKRFAIEYLKDLNATRAAIRAGYSEKTGYSQGQRLLKNAEVQSFIAASNEKRLNRLEISADRVLQEISLLAFANMLDYVTVTPKGEAFVDLSKLTREQASAIQEITVDEAAGGAGDGRRERVQRTRFKLADKGLNLERLGRHLKLFTDKLEVVGDATLIERLAAGRKRLAGK